MYSLSVLSSLASFTKGYRRPYLVLKILDSLRNLEDKNIKVQLIWIPTHVVIPLNKAADEAAKEAASSGQMSIYRILVSDLNSFWKEEMQSRTLSNIREYGQVKGKYYCGNYLEKFGKLWFAKYNIPRKALVSINRMRSSHT